MSRQWSLIARDPKVWRCGRFRASAGKVEGLLLEYIDDLSGTIKVGRVKTLGEASERANRFLLERHGERESQSRNTAATPQTGRYE